MCNITVRQIEWRFLSFKIFIDVMIFIQRLYTFIRQKERIFVSKTYFMRRYNSMLPKRRVPFSLGSFAFIALGGNQL